MKENIWYTRSGQRQFLHIQSLKQLQDTPDADVKPRSQVRILLMILVYFMKIVYLQEETA